MEDKKRLVEEIKKEEREKNAKLYGFKNTRNNKRESEKLYKEVNDNFGKICTEFNNIFIENKFNMKLCEDAFAESEIKWRGFCRGIIHKNIKTFNTKPKRNRILGRFQEFVESLNNKIENA